MSLRWRLTLYSTIILGLVLVIFGVFLVDLEIILRDIHKLRPQEHVTDPCNLADWSE